VILKFGLKLGLKPNSSAKPSLKPNLRLNFGFQLSILDLRTGMGQIDGLIDIWGVLGDYLSLKLKFVTIFLDRTSAVLNRN